MIVTVAVAVYHPGKIPRELYIGHLITLEKSHANSTSAIVELLCMANIISSLKLLCLANIKSIIHCGTWQTPFPLYFDEKPSPPTAPDYHMTPIIYYRRFTRYTAPPEKEPSTREAAKTLRGAAPPPPRRVLSVSRGSFSGYAGLSHSALRPNFFRALSRLAVLRRPNRKAVADGLPSVRRNGGRPVRSALGSLSPFARGLYVKCTVP